MPRLASLIQPPQTNRTRALQEVEHTRNERGRRRRQRADLVLRHVLAVLRVRRVAGEDEKEETGGGEGVRGMAAVKQWMCETIRIQTKMLRVARANMVKNITVNRPENCFWKQLGEHERTNLKIKNSLDQRA